MCEFKIGFIGAGNMGSALAKAASKKDKNIILADNNIEKAKKTADALGCTAGDNENVAKESYFIFLGVKPQVLPSLLEEIAPVLTNRKDEFILVTMAAGVSINSINSALGSEYPIIRIMPNTPVSLGEGMILYSVNKEVSTLAEKEFLSIMENAGRIHKLSEDLIDAGSVVSGCGPAFVYMFIDALAKGGEKVGLEKADALKFAAQTALGAAKMILESDEEPEVLIDRVCSPGGSTIEGVKSLRANNLEKTTADALAASFKRTKELNI